MSGADHPVTYALKPKTLDSCVRRNDEQKTTSP